jgi:hypothetical protein
MTATALGATLHTAVGAASSVGRCRRHAGTRQDRHDAMEMAKDTEEMGLWM